MIVYSMSSGKLNMVTMITLIEILRYRARMLGFGDLQLVMELYDH